MTEGELEVLQRKADRARIILEDSVFNEEMDRIHSDALDALKRMKVDNYDFETTRTQLIERMNAVDHLKDALRAIVQTYESTAKKTRMKVV